MKKIFIATFALLAYTGVNVMAQDNNDDSKKREEMMKKMTTEQAERIAKELDLDESKTTTFKELYVEYRTKELKLRTAAMPKRNGEKGEKKEKKAPSMTDAQADSLITASFEQAQKELDLKKTYYEKFRKQFTASQLVKVFAEQPRAGRNRQQRNGQGGDNNGPGGFGGPGGGDFGGPGMGGGF